MQKKIILPQNRKNPLHASKLSDSDLNKCKAAESGVLIIP